jgi:hypothetical protein
MLLNAVDDCFHRLKSLFTVASPVISAINPPPVSCSSLAPLPTADDDADVDPDDDEASDVASPSSPLRGVACGV